MGRRQLAWIRLAFLRDVDFDAFSGMAWMGIRVRDPVDRLQDVITVGTLDWQLRLPNILPIFPPTLGTYSVICVMGVSCLAPVSSKCDCMTSIRRVMLGCVP